MAEGTSAPKRSAGTVRGTLAAIFRGRPPIVPAMPSLRPPEGHAASGIDMLPGPEASVRAGDLPILRNPFHVLGVSTRDDRRRVVEAAEEKSLSLDGEVCARARAELTHPRNRLAAELAWLPGVPADRSAQLVDDFVRDPAAVLGRGGLPALARANLTASAMLVLDVGLAEADWIAAIVAFSRAVEEVSADRVLAAVNEDRAVAGVATVNSVERVEEGLAERRLVFCENLRDALDTLPSRKLAAVVAAAVEALTEGGRRHPPALVDGLMDVYAAGTLAFMTREAGNVGGLIARARAATRSRGGAVEPFVERLAQVLRNWHSVARPMQMLAAARGSCHGPSQQTAGAVRELGVFLFRNRRTRRMGRRVMELLKETFADVPEIAGQADEDIRRMDDLVQRPTPGNAASVRPPGP